MKKKPEIIWVEILYLGLFLSVIFHALFWSGRIAIFFVRPLYRLRWGWHTMQPFLIIITVLLMIFISQWVLMRLIYVEMPSLLRNALYITLIPSTVLILLALPILVVVNHLEYKIIHPEFASPSGQFTVETVGTSDTCHYRIYSNYFIVQKYVGQFPANTYNCASGEIFRWSEDERHVDVVSDDQSTIRFELP